MNNTLLFSSVKTLAVDEQAAVVDVCVLGAGPVAAASILLARQLGLRVSHIAPLPNKHHQVQNTVARTYAISPVVQTGLARLGVWDLMADSHKQRCTDMQVFWQTAHKHLVETYPVHLTANSANVPHLCTFVPEDALQTALNTALTVTRGQQGATLFYDAQSNPQAVSIQSCNQGTSAVEISIANSTNRVRAQLCIVAEGAGSRSAAALNLAPTVFDYGHHAVVAELHAHVAPNTAASIVHTAWQWLGDECSDDVLALLPMGFNALDDTVRYGLVWSQPSSQAAHYVAHADDLLAAVQQRIAKHAPQLLTAGGLTVHSAVQQFPLFKSHAPAYIAPHIALVGDTAHKIHPLAGQGLNLGFEDAFALFDSIAQRESWRSIGDARVLARYQRQRMAQAGPIDAAVHALARRHAWLTPLKVLAELGLQAQADYPVVGGVVRQSLVQRMARAA